MANETYDNKRDTVNPIDELIEKRKAEITEVTNKLTAILSMWTNLESEARSNPSSGELKGKIDSIRDQATKTQEVLEALKESLKNISE
ncbi:MAG: hypothetical protein Q8P11_02245 [bacterium]|nr:hypothetical protein [bacterium]